MSSSTRVVILCDWLPPDFGAVGQYILKFAREFASEGRAVILIGFSSGDCTLSMDRVGAGSLRVLRVHRRPYDRSRWFGRALWTLTANLALMRAAWRELRDAEEVRFTGSPPYLLHFIMPVAKLLGVRTHYRIADFHPECLIAALGRKPFWLKAIHVVTIFWRRRVNVIEVLGEDQRKRIEQCGIPAQRVRVVRDPSPVSFDAAAAPARVPPELNGRKVILYSGNWGIAHDHATFIAAYGRFSRRHGGAAGLWLNAIGKGAAIVERELCAAGLCHARTMPVPIEQLASVLLAADLHLITLADAFVGYVLPSKVYACAASGRPVLFIGSSESDVHLICRERVSESIYRRADVGDTDAVVCYLEELLLPVWTGGGRR